MANILLLEPNRVLARTYQATLQAAGHQVALAHSAQEAIHAAHDQLPAVVLLELQLAGHDGIEFLHEFRSYPEWQLVPAVVVSHMVPAQLKPFREVLRQDLGVTACLYKPRMTLERLLKTVAEQLAA